MGNQLSAINHVVVLALENRSFDQMLGFLYTDQGNKSTSGQEYEGLSGNEFNLGANNKPVKVFRITPDMPNAYFMPGCDPGEDYFHLLQNGEIYVQRGTEKYCLNCALKMHVLSEDRLHWQHRANRPSPPAIEPL